MNDEAKDFNERCQQLEGRFRKMMEQETSSRVWVATITRTLGLLLTQQENPEKAFEQVVELINKHIQLSKIPTTQKNNE